MIRSRFEACNILGVPIEADDETVKRAYRRLAKYFHPDSGNVLDGRRYNLICEAYDYLKNNPYVQPVVPQTAPKTGKILGGTTGKTYNSGRDYSAFNKKYEKQKAESKQKFNENLAAYSERMRKQEEEYKKAMDAINAIRIAEAIKLMIAKGNPDK